MRLSIDHTLLANKRIVVALSGGADSVALLHYMKTNTDYHITAVHVHHGLQAVADEWPYFCRDYCSKLGVPLVVETVTLNDTSEDSARRARYAALSKHGDLILTGHHSDDQIETFFMKLTRGAGVSGLKGMSAHSKVFGVEIYRPMLTVSRQDVETYCLDNHLDYVTDPSNLKNHYNRNFFRNSIIPAISDRFTNVKQAMLKSIGILADADKCLSELAEMDIAAVTEDGKLNIKKMREMNLSSERIRNMILHIAHEQGLTINYNDLVAFSVKLQTIGYDAQMEIICKKNGQKFKFKQCGRYISLPT